MNDLAEGEVQIVRGPRRWHEDGRRIWWRGWYVQWRLPGHVADVQWCYTRWGAGAVARWKLFVMGRAR